MLDTPLRRLRERKGLTLEAIAVPIGTDTGNLSRIERGEQRSLDLAEKIVVFFTERYRSKRLLITESQILFPERYPPARKKGRKVRADVAGAARG